MPDEDEDEYEYRYEAVHEGGEAYMRRVRVKKEKRIQHGAREEEARVQQAAREQEVRVLAETNAPELLRQAELELYSALEAALKYPSHLADPYLRIAEKQPVYIKDIIENYRRLRDLLDTLAAQELWPCILTQSRPPFAAPLDVPPDLAAILVDHIRLASTGELPFPSAAANLVQFAALEKADDLGLSHLQPLFYGDGHKFVGLPTENAEAGFVRGAKLDTDLRVPFSPPEPPDQVQEPPRARVAVETEKPNLTVVWTHGYFTSRLGQLGVSTPATGNLAYGLYRFGLEHMGRHWFQESLVSVPDQLRVSLEITIKDKQEGD
jgi:hypothetical protein